MARLQPYTYGDDQTPDGDEGVSPDGALALRTERAKATAPAPYQPNDPSRQTPATVGSTATQANDRLAQAAPPRTFAQMQAEGYARPPMPAPSAPSFSLQPGAPQPGANLSQVASSVTGGARPGVGGAAAALNALQGAPSSPMPMQSGGTGSTVVTPVQAGALQHQQIVAPYSYQSPYNDALAGGTIPSYITDPTDQQTFSTLLDKINTQGFQSLNGQEQAQWDFLRDRGSASGSADAVGGKLSGVYAWDPSTMTGDLPPDAADEAKRLAAAGAGPSSTASTPAGPARYLQGGVETNADGSAVPGGYNAADDIARQTGQATTSGAMPVASPASAGTASGGVGSAAVPVGGGGGDVLSFLTNGVNGQGAGSGVQNATQNAVLNMLNSPSPYGSQQVKDFYNTEAGNIDDQFALQRNKLAANMASRGLGASSINAGNLNDLNIGQRSAKVDLADRLGQNFAQSLGNYQLGAINAGNTVGNAAQQGQQSWLSQLMGYGQQAFNNDLATNAVNQNAANNYQNFILGLLGYGGGA